MKKTFAVTALGIAGLTLNAHADSGDMNTIIGLSGASYEFIEPEFTTDSETLSFPLVVGFSWQTTAVDRFTFLYRQLDEEVGNGSSAGPNEVGLQIEGDQFSVFWERKLRLSRAFKPWVGVGFTTNFLESTNKFKTDDDGFLAETFDDRDDTTLSGLVSASLERELNEAITVGASLAYEIAFDDSPEGLVYSLQLKYRLPLD